MYGLCVNEFGKEQAAAMQETDRIMRLAVLFKLFGHLREHYDSEWAPGRSTR
jgi:hypothetical protein